MAYVHRVVKAGPCVEHKKMQSFRVHTKGVKRGPNTGHTTEKQERINERVAEEHLRWDINANFGHRDLHAVLHYYVKDSSFEEILENKAAFLRNLRKLCKKRGITFKAVVVIETKRMTNPHIHVIISRMDPEIITEAWENVPRGGGGISFKPMDRRGNHYKLAAYLMKESRSTMERYREIGKRRTWTSRKSHTPPCLRPAGERTRKRERAPCCISSTTDPPAGAGGMRSAVTHTRSISRFSTNRRVFCENLHIRQDHRGQAL